MRTKNKTTTMAKDQKYNSQQNQRNDDFNDFRPKPFGQRERVFEILLLVANKIQLQQLYTTQPMYILCVYYCVCT